MSEDMNIQTGMFDNGMLTEEELDSAFILDFEFFQGPIELLLTLVKKTKIPIMEVHLADITDAYLEAIKEQEKIDMDNASAFITVATMLIEIKAKSLLPETQEQQDPIPLIDAETALKLQMQKYELFKQASEKLKKSEEVNMFFKPADEGATDTRFVLKDMTLDSLLDAFSKMLTKVEVRAKVNEPRQIVKDRFTVADKIVHIVDVVKIRKSVKFDELFDSDYSRSEIINTFLALLELLKLQKIAASQEGIFGSINISYKGEGLTDETGRVGQDY